MDKNKQRVEILKRLVTANGGPAEFARTRSQAGADKPIDPTYVSQVLNGHRAFGERAAHNMQKRAGLPPDYFSKGDNECFPTPPEATEAAQIFSEMDEKDRSEVLHWLRIEAIRRRHA